MRRARGTKLIGGVGLLIRLSLDIVVRKSRLDQQTRQALSQLEVVVFRTVVNNPSLSLDQLTAVAGASAADVLDALCVLHAANIIAVRIAPNEQQRLHPFLDHRERP